MGGAKTTGGLFTSKKSSCRFCASHLVLRWFSYWDSGVFFTSGLTYSGYAAGNGAAVVEGVLVALVCVVLAACFERALSVVELDVAADLADCFARSVVSCAVSLAVCLTSDEALFAMLPRLLALFLTVEVAL